MSNKPTLPFPKLGGMGKTTAADIRSGLGTLHEREEVVLCAGDEGDDDESSDCGSERQE